MSRQLHNRVALLLIGLTLASGCTPTQPFYFHEDGDLSHYLDKATEIEYPDVESSHLADAHETKSPMTLTNPEFNEIWDLSLEECLHIAMQNSKVLRNLGGITPSGFGADGVIGRTTGSTTVYDSAIQESAPSQVARSNTSGGVVNRVTAAQAGGVESALSDFDSILSITNPTGLGGVYTRDDRPVNFGALPPFSNPNDQDNAGWRAALSKRTATGSRFQVLNQTTYQRFNNDTSVGRPLANQWTTAFEVQWDQPLLRGRGTEINRIPIVLARINTDISLAVFEQAVRNLVKDIEDTYWDLHCAYRRLETAKTGRDSAQVTWKIVFEKWQEGVEPVQAEAEARGQYFLFRSQVEEALGGTQGQAGQDGLYALENKLRYLMGIAATDGRLIRPSDEPTMARVDFDWRDIRTEALVRSPELRQQKWAIKQRKLELLSAKNQLLPQMDVGVLYRWIGLGNQLITADRNNPPFPETGSTAFQELTRGEFQEAAFTFNFVLPVGFRNELAGVRNAQLQLARDKARLEDMELSQTHVLTAAVRALDTNYVLAQTQFNRWVAAEKEVESVQALYTGGKTTIDRVLDAQRRRAEAEDAHYRALCNYNKSIAEVHFRKGSLLDYNNVFLSEGPWHEKAYWDAIGRARERDASYYLDYGWTRPAVVSRGPVPQGVTKTTEVKNADAEPVASPQPTPAGTNGNDDSQAPLPVPELGPPPTPEDSVLPNLGPFTEEVPLLNAPIVPASAAETQDRTVQTVPTQRSPVRFDWHDLDNAQRTRGGTQGTPAAGMPTGIQPATFLAPVYTK